MAFCRNCGNSLPENVKFCPNCGTSNDAVAQSSGNQIRQEGYIPRSWIEDGGSTQPVQPGAYSNTGSNPISGTYQNTGSYNTAGGYQSSYVPPVSSQPVKTKKKLNPAIFVIGALVLLLAILVVVLVGNSDEKNDPNLGMYQCVSREAMGVDIGGGTDWVELKSGDRVTVCMEDEEYNGKWTLDGEEITITQAGDTFMGTLSDGVLVVDFSDLICTYVMDGVVVNEPAVEELSIDYSWWEGDWYGWWIMNNTAGEYADLEDCCWDACARIELDSNGVGTIHLWDTDDEPGKYFSISDIEIVSGSGDMGCMVSTEGDIYDYSIGYADWYVDPASSYTSCYDNFIAIEGYYEAPSSSSDNFEYFIFLRPWGTEWEDVRNDAENPDMPYTDMMPVGYDDWYMSNIYGPMPDSFN